MNLLKKSGKLVRKDGKLVRTDNPAACPCCGGDISCTDCQFASATVSVDFPAFTSEQDGNVLFVCDGIKGSVDIPLVWDGLEWKGNGSIQGYEWGSGIDITVNDCNPPTADWAVALDVLVGCRDPSSTFSVGTQSGGTRQRMKCNGSWSGDVGGPGGPHILSIKLNPGRLVQKADNPLP